jgi:tellurite resistance protein
LSVKNLPIGFYGAVMGLVGLGLSARAAAPLFPGVVRAPAYFTELWVALGVLAFVILVPAYLAKLFLYPKAVKEEFSNPAQLGFCGTLPVGMTLVAGGVAPYASLVADVLWWASYALILALQVWALSRWLSGGIELAQVNGAWLIAFVGGIVVPGSGLALGHFEASRFLFGISAAGAPLLMALLLYRAVLAQPLPEALRPSWFILLVPPSLIYANGIALFEGTAFLEALYFSALVLAAALLVYARGFLRWPFAPSWWAFTFPLDALAYAAARYAQEHPSMLWKAVAGIALALATLFVVIVLLQNLRSAASRRR